MCHACDPHHTSYCFRLRFFSAERDEANDKLRPDEATKTLKIPRRAKPPRPQTSLLLMDHIYCTRTTTLSHDAFNAEYSILLVDSDHHKVIQRAEVYHPPPHTTPGVLPIVWEHR